MKKRADGRYCKAIVINGRKKFFYGLSPAEVNRKILAFKDKQKNGRFFSEASDEWYKEHSKNVEHYTAECYKAPLKDVKAEFDSYRVTDIKPLAIENFLKKYSKKGFAKQTVKLRLIALRLIFDYLIINNEIKINPAAACKVKGAKPAKKIKAATPEQLKIIDDNISLPFGLFPFIMAYTGCRREEGLPLNWEDFNFEGEILEINKTVIFKKGQPELRCNKAKTEGSIRSVILRKKLIEKLRPYAKKSGLIFEGKCGLMTLSEVRKAWNKYKQATGLTLTFTQLRHAYSTALYEAGIDSKSGITQTGHSSTYVLENIYQEVRNQQYGKIAEKLNKYDELG